MVSKRQSKNALLDNSYKELSTSKNELESNYDSLKKQFDDLEEKYHKAEEELATAIEKALNFFSENISIIESMSKELLGESQTVAEFAKSKE